MPAGIVLVVKTKWRRETVRRISIDSFPAYVIAIASAFGINQEAEHGVKRNGLEKVGAVWRAPKSPARVLLISGVRRQNLFLLFGGRGRKARNSRIKSGRQRVYFGNSFVVHRLGIACESLQ